MQKQSNSKPSKVPFHCINSNKKPLGIKQQEYWIIIYQVIRLIKKI